MTSPATRLLVVPALTALLAGPVLSACGAAENSDADSGRLQIAAAFYPLQYAAERVAGEHAEVSNLTKPGMEPHELSLSVQQVAAVSEADLVVFEHGFQAAVDEAVEHHAQGATVDAAEAVELKPVTDHDEHADEPAEDREGESAEEHAEHEGEAAEEGHEEHGHDVDGLDPHFWQDPLLMADLGDALAAELSEIDEANAAAYEANAAALRKDLEALDAEYADGLAGCERDLVVVNHDAFSYLDRYDIHLEPISGISPDSEPTAADLAELHSVIKEEGITTVFAETLVSKKTAETLASDLGITTAVLDPLEGMTGDGDYVSVMRENLTALKTANGC